MPLERVKFSPSKLTLRTHGNNALHLDLSEHAAERIAAVFIGEEVEPHIFAAKVDEGPRVFGSACSLEEAKAICAKAGFTATWVGFMSDEKVSINALWNAKLESNTRQLAWIFKGQIFARDRA